MSFSRALYFAAILPPPGIREQVLELKLEMKEKFETSHALKLPAHITLVPPVWLENKQEHLFVDAVRIVTEETPSFPVELKDFGHFGQRVIFINAINPSRLKEFYQNLLNSLTEFLPNKGAKLHPHVTIATRDLSRQNFNKAWKEYKDRSFSVEFNAESLTIFKHNGKTWNILETFLLKK
ncbi:2'-5' RNA ligase family protein [Salinimicrobium sediminilitoris]|uniref:2'-5' RNA ligase family protein n=1 Tax=Salinimicrobium sediminilitoris TaxID=2876715 RepID=UPI001E4E9986|nr:2'-5' RNA ligase family protein [Salinimicrobium sediminilitoris]MCC8360336.1 2'-5' RNA ligase family protein [Salinimicrobium sediminilitoris]